MTRFEKIKVGDKAELKHVVTQSDIESFVDLSGDDNKIHVDAEYVGKTAFKKPIAHGMLGVSFISTVLGTKLPGHGSVWVSQNLEFLLPVRVGDELSVQVEVLSKMDRMQIIELKTDIFNQNMQKVTSGIGKAKIIEQEVHPIDDTNPGRKIALVIGGSGGIGRAACLKLAREGYDIAIHYHHNKEQARLLKEKITSLGRQAICVRADITDNAEVKLMFENILQTYESLGVVVNCSTIRIPNIKFEDTDWSLIQRHLDISVKGHFNVLKYVVPLMEKNKYGKIIAITMQAAEVLPVAQWLPYITGKAALGGFSKALAVELAPKGIRVNMISPSLVDTDLISDVPEKERLIIASKTPLRRIAKPEDIANAIFFLASAESDFITGETIRVSGGLVML